MEVASFRKRPALCGAAVVGPLAVMAGILLAGFNLLHYLGYFRDVSTDIAIPLNLRWLIVQYTLLPRITVALLAGSALALSGTLMQQVLRNPIADPTTLGSSAGAHLSLVLCSLFLPSLSLISKAVAGFCGAALATSIVILLAWGPSFSRMRLVVSGMIISLFCGASASVLVLFNEKVLQSVFLWSAGSLAQSGWSMTWLLLPIFAPCAILSWLLARPLMMAELGDESARSLGAPIAAIRIVVLLVAVLLAGSVAGTVGVLGFVGLAAGNIARMMGARSFAAQLIWSPVIGAGIILSADQIVVTASGSEGNLPTGIVVALLGAPLLIFLIRRMTSQNEGSHLTQLSTHEAKFYRYASLKIWIGSATLVLLAIVMALFVSTGPDGLWVASLEEMQLQFHWRGPRVVAGLASGGLMAIAGAVLQRVTANPLASPEVVGVSAGAALGAVAALFLLPVADRLALTVGATAGALAAFVVVSASARMSQGRTDAFLLAGVAVGSLFSTFLTLFMSLGDPRILSVITWMSGSLYRVSWTEAILAASAFLVLGPLALLTNRWLDLMVLGLSVPTSLGLDVRRSQFLLIVLTALMVSVATLVVGPLSFVGLVAPHAARVLPGKSAFAWLINSALVGACLMVIADWLGRTIHFPYQVPAGLVAAILGSPVFLVLVRRGSR